MKKPWWVRVVGWLGVMALVAGLVMQSQYRSSSNPGYALGLIILSVLGAGCVGAWCLISGCLWVLRRQALAQAEAFGGQRPPLQPAPARRGDGAPLLPVELPLAQTGIVCGRCRGSRAVLHCCRHEMTLCWRCAVAVDSADCAYMLANRYADAPAQSRERPRTVVTSPLSGAR